MVDLGFVFYWCYGVERGWVVMLCWFMMVVVLCVFVVGYLLGWVDGFFDCVLVDFFIGVDGCVLIVYYGWYFSDYVFMEVL